VLLVASAVAVNSPRAQAQPVMTKKWNVLLIIADDLNTHLGCYGSRVVKTPHIDRLAARGLRFDRAYCQYPYCNPSRASLLTGLRPGTTRVFANRTHFRTALPDCITLAQLFRQDGYFSARVGKIFHMGVPEDIVPGTAGLDDPKSWDVALNPAGKEQHSPGKGRNLTPQYTMEKSSSTAFHCLAADGAGEDQADFKYASEAIKLLQQKRDRPFFLAVGFVRPHVPLVAPKRYFDLYPLGELKPVTNALNDRADIPAPAITGKEPDYAMKPEQCREVLQGYYASVSFMDAQVGRLLDALQRLGLADNTTVVFVSDHGYHLGEHQMWQKQSLFEESARVPLVIAGPMVKNRGSACPRLVELVDLNPTLVDLCGLRAQPDLEGVSFSPLLATPELPWKKAAFTEVSRGKVSGRSVRTERWRYTEWHEKKGPAGVELYDHQNDSREFTNLAQDPRHAATVAELKALLHKGWKGALPPNSGPSIGCFSGQRKEERTD
jgi:iduronate 2-sulfatase